MTRTSIDSSAHRDAEVRFRGYIDNTPDSMKRLVGKLSGKYLQLLFCYQAGLTGYGLHRRITALGQDCSVIALQPGGRPVLAQRSAVEVAKSSGSSQELSRWQCGHAALSHRCALVQHRSHQFLLNEAGSVSGLRHR
jgi:hypothetical protein